MPKLQSAGSGVLPCVRMVTQLEELEALRVEWDGLVQTSPQAGVAQTYLYAQTAWESRRPDAQSLLVIVAEVAGQMVAVWPLYVAKPGKLRIVRLLGCGGREEYQEPLIAPGCPHQDAVVAEFYRLATAAGDLLEAYNLSLTTPLLLALKADRRPKHQGRMGSPLIELSKYPSWDAWFATKTRTFRHSLRSARRRLALGGTPRFREVSAAEAPKFIDWLFATKQAWLERKGQTGHWIWDPFVCDFYKLALGKPGSGVLGFSLDVDGRPIAGAISLVCASRMEFYIVTYDPTFAAVSPGNLLIEDLVRWCMPRKLDFDFRLTGAPYKDSWIDQVEPYVYYDVACTWRGVTTVMGRQAVYSWQALKGGAKQRLLQVLRRMRRR